MNAQFKYVNMCVAPFPFQITLLNLTTNNIYEVKVSAASISPIHPQQIIHGSYSEPKKVCAFAIRIVESSIFISFMRIFFFFSFFIQILLQPNCEKIQPLLRQQQDGYSLAMMVVILLSLCGLILIIMAFLLWR